jgi:hypothetical protein
VLPVLTAPEWDCHSWINWPRPLNFRWTWLTILPPLAASKLGAPVRSESVTGRARCLNWARPHLWEPWELTPWATQPSPQWEIHDHLAFSLSSSFPLILVISTSRCSGVSWKS